MFVGYWGLPRVPNEISWRIQVRGGDNLRGNAAVLFDGRNDRRGAHDAEDAEQPAAADVPQAACR